MIATLSLLVSIFRAHAINVSGLLLSLDKATASAYFRIWRRQGALAHARGGGICDISVELIVVL